MEDQMPKKTLSQSMVSEATCPQGQAKVDYFDTKVTGLLLKVLPSGKKSFYLRFRSERGKTVERMLADALVLELDAVRKLARERLAQIALGQDPFELQRSLKAVPTFSAFVADSFIPYIKGYKRSWRTDVSLLNNHILPAIGDLYLDEITRRDLVDLFSKHRETHKPGSTNRIIILCRYIFNCALRWDTVGLKQNPVAGIDLLPEHNKLERYLSKEETQRLFVALEQSEAPMLKYIISMLLLTGARKREVLDAKWQDFDLERRIWTIEFNKTGKPRFVPISDGVIRLLETVPRTEGSDYVFPNPNTQEPYTSIFYAWDTARKRAGLKDVRIHDLRHSFASFLINSGRSLYEVQKILGHTQVKTTQRYAHLSQDSLMTAMNSATSVVPLVASMPVAATTLPLLAVA
jgi:integrase